MGNACSGFLYLLLPSACFAVRVSLLNPSRTHTHTHIYIQFKCSNSIYVYFVFIVVCSLSFICYVCSYETKTPQCPAGRLKQTDLRAKSGPRPPLSALIVLKRIKSKPAGCKDILLKRRKKPKKRFFKCGNSIVIHIRVHELHQQ